MFMANVELFFKIQNGMSPESITYLNGYPEENPKVHVFEAMMGTNRQFYAVEEGEGSLMIRRVEDPSELEVIEKTT